jgi:hypothetical protein
MKQLLIGMVALVMCFGITSCSQESTPNLADIVAKAKTDGANWDVEEWQEAYTQMLTAVKPMLLETQEIIKTVEAKDGEELHVEKVTAAAAKLEEIYKKYPDYENLISEFNSIAERSENGKKVLDDEAFAKKVAKELGLPEDL